jgi:two-component system, chemotaxis family, sensor kinase Cph1
MNDLTDFFRNLFDSSDWPPRWHCGKWTDFHGWLYIVSDLLVWGAYFAIPLIIVRYISRKTNIKFSRIYFLFAAFILACGATHFLDAVAFWYPAYRLSALVRLFTGIISWVTVYYLIKSLPALFAMRSAKEVEIELEETKLREFKKGMVRTMELERKNKELEQFAYVASHDLQEPLRTTSSFIEIFKEKYLGKMDEETDDILNYISQSNDRMKVLIKDLLDYSRIGRKPVIEDVNCNEVLDDVLADLSVNINETNTTIFRDKLPEVRGYPTELKQLFQNLVSNSIKFRRPGTDPQIQISAARENGHWQFAISDNGIGMEESDTERIFVIFQRLHTRTEYEGSGIGLSFCKKIVELHGGNIWVKSKPGEGSTFFFTIHEM